MARYMRLQASLRRPPQICAPGCRVIDRPGTVKTHSPAVYIAGVAGTNGEAERAKLIGILGMTHVV